MSTHVIEVVEIGDVIPHPDPEVTKMEITHVLGWQCCVGKDQFKKGDKAVYIEPDYLVPTDRPEFAFLRKEGRSQERIRVRRLRGQLSQGLMISLPPEFKDATVGTNLITELGIERYEPPAPKSTYGNYVSAPSGLYLPKFDVECYQRYNTVFVPGEPVVITEKIHGANARFVYATDPNTGEQVQFCGSRTNWMAEDDKNIWWMAYRQNPAIGEWCKQHPELVLYGEVFGQVQDLKYGAKKNDIFFIAFAMLNKHAWVNYSEFSDLLKDSGVATAPLIYRGSFDEKMAYELAEGDSKWPNANHLAEGVVVIPEIERVDSTIGRVMLKIVSNRYLERK